MPNLLGELEVKSYNPHWVSLVSRIVLKGLGMYIQYEMQSLTASLLVAFLELSLAEKQMAFESPTTCG